MKKNNCSHTQTKSEYITIVNDWTGEEESNWEYTTINTTEDIDLHRYKCTQCGLIMYYSGRAREHYEEGKIFEWIKGLNGK